ncbi:MAG: ABC-type multidrug transport system, ATPase and permease component [Acidimicrobiaceae bacterium]|nr:ABC-type multidrug transport system, ATPase and permease component [Acidimicrobiaceae bacterium]
MTDGHHHSVTFEPGSRSWKHLPRVVPYLRRYWGLASGMVGLLFVGTVVSLAEPWPMAFLVNAALTRGGRPGWVGDLFGRNVRVLVLVAAGAGLLLVLASNGLSVVNEYVGTKLDNHLTLDLRRDVFRRAQQLSLHYHDTRRAGYFAQNINAHTTALGQIVVGIPPLLQSVLTLIGMFVIAALLDLKVALASLAVVPLIYFATVFYSRRIEPNLIHVRDQEGLSLSIIQEAMQMLRVILTFRREDHELQRFSEQASYALNLRVGLTVKQTLFSLAVNVFTAIGSALVLGLGSLDVLSHRLSIGELLVLVAYIANVYKPLQTISYTISTWQDQLVSFWLALEMLDEEPDIVERADALTLNSVRGQVRFDHVDFSYPDRPRILANITCDIAAGSTVGVVGPTGAGKSTFAALVSRLYDPEQGRVLIDGVDLRDLKLDSVRGNVAVVLQEPLLFLGTIADNIRYGRLDASDDDVVEAAKGANAHDFIEKLPLGYETRVGERGSMLSGGERQRICIARAFLKDAPILVLDEPTSSIDSQTEGVILEALSRLVRGKTAFVIAHRLSTLVSSTRILVIDGGNLVEDGTHDELVARGGLYRTLWEHQTASRRSSDEQPLEPPALAPSPRSGPDDPGALPIVAPALASRPKAVVLGLMSTMPVAGVAWQTVHYLLGLEKLGFDAYYVEAHARTPAALMTSIHDDSSKLAAAFIASTLERFGFADRWAFHALHDDGRCLGMSEAELSGLYRDAAVIFNLHGGTAPRPEHSASRRLVYIETDPCQLQSELANGVERTIDFLDQHVAFFTFGENIGHSDCLVPTTDHYTFWPTRQPVVTEMWDSCGERAGANYTTIGNWRQPWRAIVLDGETYQWSKDQEFRKFLELPSAVGVSLELALSSLSDEDRRGLEEHHWRVSDGLEISSDLDRYRSYIAQSRGEFTVAKDQNVRLRSGWFSDRSATYLAAGRPVVTQDTGFGNHLPTGDGLFSFSSSEEAVEAFRRIESDYSHHEAAARAIAKEYFAAERVLGDLVDHLDCRPLARRRARGASEPASEDLVLTPTSRRPLQLAPQTTDFVLSREIPRPSKSPAAQPRASVVVATFNRLDCTRLCLESVLEVDRTGVVELIVVDNASSDGTATYLERLAGLDPRVRVLSNADNRGFAAAINQGLERATAGYLVILNNDTIVCDGWLDGLLEHLTDPEIGAVGPVTGRSGTESEVASEYRTFGELRSFAAERARTHSGDTLDVTMLSMFCLAVRRGTYERVGPLDERYGIGLFEDDDYSERLSLFDYRLVCAQDVYVHHFGEASFGTLVPAGEYGELFELNRTKFEEKWGKPWEGHTRQWDPVYEGTVERIRFVLGELLPTSARALVVSKGDPRLLSVATASHFPRSESGEYIGYNPRDSDEAVEMVRSLERAGATHFVVPDFSRWWLDYYAGLSEYLDQHADLVINVDACSVYALGGDVAGPVLEHLSRSAS